MSDDKTKQVNPAGKGDKPRPKQISEEEWDKKYEETFKRVDRIAKMLILTPSRIEQIEKMMILGQLTQKDGVKLINSHRCLQAKVDRLEKENE